MTDVNTLIHRIDQELEVDVNAQEMNWEEVVQANRERAPRLERYETVAKHVIELLKPRMAAFLDRFKDVVKPERTIREHTRAVSLKFLATVANVSVLFEMFPDPDVTHVRLECTQEIIPVVVPYDKGSVFEFPLDAAQDDAVIQWFDDRVVAIVKAYLGIFRQDEGLQRRLKDQFVEDPVSKVRFPKYLASSTLERDGKTYYFVDQDTRREFDKQPTAK